MSTPKLLRDDARARQLGLAFFAAGFVLLMQGYRNHKPPMLLKLFHPLVGEK